ncbi:MAG TPA: adenosine kinase [Acidimicrobiales bacterium]|nr:adenosine kinase [Acidimicrobiales bacterium]
MSNPDGGADRALDVVAIGSALVDVLAHGTDEELARQGLVKGSMALVDLDRSNAIYKDMAAGIEVSGGSAANTVVGVAALGGRSGFLGKVADDQFGELFLHDLSAAGVSLGHTRPTPSRLEGEPGEGRGEPLATGRCLVIVTGEGERTMATHLGAATTFGPEDVDEPFVMSANVLYLEGYLWDLPPAKAAMRRATELAHQADVLVALSASDPFCVERHRREFLDLLRDDVDVLFANEEEVKLLFGAGSFDRAAGAVEETGLLAALTRGASGSVVVTAGGTLEVPAAEVDQVVDTTGAGDLYAAGFLFGLTRGHEPYTCAQLGGLCAAEVISHLGARPQVDLADLAKRTKII